MAIVKSPGLVLQRIPFGDSSIILKVYTSEHGLLSFMVKGSRHPRSKFRAVTDFFLLVQWVHPLASRGEMLTLHDASLLEDMPSLRTEPIKQALAQTWLEIYLRLSPASGESQQRFDWLLQHLQSLDASLDFAEAMPLSIDFLVGFCALSGFAPQFRNCVHCGCEIALTAQSHAKLRMHRDLGGPICKLCLQMNRKRDSRAESTPTMAGDEPGRGELGPGEIVSLPCESALLIERAQAFGYPSLLGRKIALQSAEQFLWDFLDRHATEGRRLKAREVYRTLIEGVTRA